ncbi:MAG: 1-deoxy-D-xylulose-5-phosphate reductoisomerase [Planctomycetales bacterium]|nr:1-deoxy-D-xylulose-5-phosphate reductoisomerase [Planctomycetales bacterium]
MTSPRRIAILGATGSIGMSGLEVIASQESLMVAGLSAHRSLESLSRLAQQWRPPWVVASDAEAAAGYNWELPAETRLLTGPEGLEQLAASDDIDVVLAAIVGSAGLRASWAALSAGKDLALANKETLVVAGSLITQLAKRQGCRILPVDSEHSAIFQCLEGSSCQAVRRVILTASGGPFRTYTREQMEEVTVAQALSHPTWDMGPKITVDSATMMNKALEIIEARWLFDLAPDQIDVVVHPQSTIHSMVEFADGSVLAQMGPPDMKLPIQFALTYPERHPGPAARLDLTAPLQLDFEPPDNERFPALQLGHEVAGAGGTAGAVLNAANEQAVAEFLQGRLRYAEIVPACRDVLRHHTFDPSPTLEQLLRADRWAREEVTRWTHT